MERTSHANALSILFIGAFYATFLIIMVRFG